MNPADRFTGEPRPPIAAAQWANWARAIAGRHTHTAARHERLPLTLALRQLVFQSARWETNAWTFAPQIRLAITSLLPASILKIANERQRQSEMQVARTVRGRGERGYAGPADRSYGAAPKAVADDALIPGSRSSGFVFRSASPLKQTMHDIPLARIIARLENAETSTRLEQLVIQPNMQLVQRVTETRGRVEERANRVPLVLQNPAAANAAHGAQGDQESNSFEVTTPRGHSTGRMPWQTPNALPINLDQLTDQVARRIDNRITAYRERRGKGV